MARKAKVKRAKQQKKQVCPACGSPTYGVHRTGSASGADWGIRRGRSCSNCGRNKFTLEHEEETVREWQQSHQSLIHMRRVGDRENDD